MIRERLERTILADRQGCIARGMGEKDIPDLAEGFAAFNEALDAAVSPASDPVHVARLRALELL